MFIGLIIIAIILGVAAAVVPMDALIRKLVVVVAVILIVLAILGLLGLLPIGVDRPVVERPVVERPVIVR